jgi:hypothetical protein
VESSHEAPSALREGSGAKAKKESLGRGEVAKALKKRSEILFLKL